MALHRRDVLGGLFFVACLLVLFSGSIGSATATSTTSNTSVSVFRTDHTGFGTVGAIEAGIENGTIEPAEKVIIGETLVVEIESDRLARSMAALDGSATEQLLRSLDGPADFRIIQTNPPPQRNAKVASIGPANTTVHRAGSTTYVLIETDALTFRYPGDNRRTEIRGGEEFAIQFGYNLTGISTNETDSAGSQVEFYPFKSRFVTNGYSYTPLPPEWVKLAVRVNTAPAESLAAKLTIEDHRTRTIPISPDETPGTAEIWVDLRGVTPGTDYVLELRHDGEVTDRYTGTIQQPHAQLRDIELTEVTTELTVTDDGERVTKEINDHTAVQATVMLSHGGKLRVFDSDCTEIGSKWIDSSTKTRVTVPLWNGSQPVRDVDRSDYGVRIQTLRNQGAATALYPGPDGRSTINLDGTCQAPARATPRATRTKTPTTPPPTTVPQTAPATTLPTTDDRRSGGEGTETPGQPGFTGGMVIIAMVLLTAAGARCR
ncbi:MAG: hypothetical protein SVG88_13465 [Halobacteriales archaeon]|nr:hypothetical protein [Halobacteriales archaeon]